MESRLLGGLTFLRTVLPYITLYHYQLILIFNYKSSPKALHPLNHLHTNFWLAAVYPDLPTLDYNIAYPSYFQRSMSYTAVCSFCCVACIYLFNHHHPGIGSLTHCIRAGQYLLGATYMYICNCSQTDVYHSGHIALLTLISLFVFIVLRSTNIFLHKRHSN